MAVTVYPTLSVTEAQQLSAVRTYLLGICTTSNSSTFEVIRAESNRVPEPPGPDFIIMTPLFQERLGTNYTTYEDNIFVGGIIGTTLTVTSITQGSLEDGQLLIDSSYPIMNIAVGTQILQQLTGTPGGIGTYEVSISQNLSSETLYAGVRNDLEAVKWTVQLDIHGPNSANNLRVLETIFRSDLGVTDFDTQSNYGVEPLYASEGRQVVFVNAEQQQEYRWSIDLVMQVNPIVGTPQQFADQVKIGIVVAD